jgi:cyclomaltodextrinase / maltogenic alpha-amylase / neopullulanase
MKLNLVLIILLLLGACGAPKHKYPSQSDVFGLMMPQWLNDDTTVLFLADYFNVDGKVDSFSCKYLQVEFNSDSTQLLVFGVQDSIHLYTVELYKKGFAYQLVLKHQPKTNYVFSYTSGLRPYNVQLKGDFNGWNVKEGEMETDVNGHFFFKTLKLTPGEYAYQFVVDGQETLDPSNPLTKSNGMGGTNSLLKIEKKETGLQLVTSSYTKKKILINTKGKSDYIMVLWENYPLQYQLLKEGQLEIKIPKEANKLKRSAIRIFCANKIGIGNDVLIPLENGEVVNSSKLLDRNDIEKTVMYFMMVDRFYDGDKTNNHPLNTKEVLPKADYYGGDLAGILKKLNEGYFEKLGINALWISPIAQNPTDAWGQFKDPDTKFSGYHGYWPISSSQVDTRFGNEKIVKELLATAHKKGINVYLDYVANHVHKDHPVYQKHPEWATNLYLPDGSLNTERWDEYRLTTWFDTFMPSLNLEDKKVADFMSDSALFWIKNYDFDGFRHDATKHIPESFWRIVTQKMKNEVAAPAKRRMYQIGETYGNPQLISGYLGTGLLDAQFDFNLYDVMLPVFADRNESFNRLVKEQNRSLETYGNHHLMGNISGNQDKPRFISFADGSLDFKTPWMEYKRIGWKENIPNKSDTGFFRMALFQTYLLTIPGVPVIYYGDEIGMPGAGDPDNRRMMVFDGYNQSQSNLKQKVDELVAIRNNNLALLYGDFQWIANTKDQLVYSRRYFGNYVVVCINKSEEKFSFQFSIPDGFSVSKSQNWSSNTVSTPINQKNKITLNGQGLSSYILTFNQ